MPEAAGGVPGSADPLGREMPETTHRMVTTTSPRSRAHPVLQVPGPRGAEGRLQRELSPESGCLAATGACLSRSEPGSPGRWGQGRGRRAVPRARPSGRGRGTHPLGVPPGFQRAPAGLSHRPRAAGPAPSSRPAPPGARPSREADGNRQRCRPGEGLAPGTPLRPSLPQSPAPLPCSPAGAGEGAPRRFPGGRSLRASSGPDEGSPRPRAPSARGPGPAAPSH